MVGQSRASTQLAPEIVIGRALAAVVHPGLAWKRLSLAGRVFVAGTYFAAGYGAVLSALLIFG